MGGLRLTRGPGGGVLGPPINSILSLLLHPGLKKRVLFYYAILAKVSRHSEGPADHGLLPLISGVKQTSSLEADLLPVCVTVTES